MPITQAVNSKANIKKFSNEDLPVNPQQPVISSTYATSTAAQTVINLSFSVDQALTDQFFLFVDGKKLRLGSSNDYVFSAIGSDNTSSQVTLNQSLPAGLNIQAYKLGLKSESEFLMDNRFTQLYDAQQQGFQGFVNPNQLMVATSVTGSPAAGTFYSSIVGRTAMLDLSQDLGARMGVNRIMVQDIYQIQNEVGPNGENVYASNNDPYSQIRLLGTWSNNSDVNGTRPGSSGVANADFIEVTFYGTGLNMMAAQDTNGRNFTAGVDGGAQSANLYVTGSNILLGRNYGANTIFSLTQGLALGVHTVKVLFTGAVNQTIYGFEIVNDSASSLKVNAGTGYSQGKKYSSSAQSSFSYSSPGSGTRGGRVLLYQNGDGSIGNAFQAVNASQANLTSADHTNEEVARTIYYREFGAYRTTNDDFSNITNSSTSRAFTLDDGTTTLVGSLIQNFTTSDDGMTIQTLNGFVEITFVGTGLDVFKSDTATGTLDTFTILVDGSSIGTLGTTSSATSKWVKIVSGLPYGTHTVKFRRDTQANQSIILRQFSVYQPKKPSLPSGTVEIADYNILANYVANTTAGQETIGTGVLRKANMREISYIGTWAASFNAAVITGWLAGSSTTGDSINYVFFGTGFDFRFHNNATSSTWQFTVDGSTNVSGFTTSSYGAGVTSFTASTGTLVTSTTSTTGNGVSISNMALGVHTVKLTKTAGTGTLDMEAFDNIAPIHSWKSNVYEERQNILLIGNQGISDNRKLTPVKDALPGQKAWAQAIGVTSDPTTTSTTNIPMPDMGVTIKTSGGALEIFGIAQMSSTATNGVALQIYVDGVAVPVFQVANPVIGSSFTLSTTFVLPVSAGVHKVDMYWSTGGGTITAVNTRRLLKAREI